MVGILSVMLLMIAVFSLRSKCKGRQINLQSSFDSKLVQETENEVASDRQKKAMHLSDELAEFL